MNSNEKKFLDLKITEIKKELSKKELFEIINLVKEENTHALVSHLNKRLIKEYLTIAIKSNNIFLYVLKRKNNIIGYALYAKNQDYLIKDFYSIRYKILLNLIFRLKLFTLINILLAISKLDSIFLNKNVDLKRNCLNLNLLAVKKNSNPMVLENISLIKQLKLFIIKFLNLGL